MSNLKSKEEIKMGRIINFRIPEELYKLLEADMAWKNGLAGYGKETLSTILRDIIAQHYMSHTKKELRDMLTGHHKQKDNKD